MRVKLILMMMIIWNISFAAKVPDFYGQQKKVTVSNANIAYYRFGHGKPLVLVTGHGDSMMMWHPLFLKKMSETHDVIMFDYPGIGASTIQGEYPNTMEQLSTLVRDFITTLKVNKPDILGFSMGGSLVLYMTTQCGDTFGHVILIGAKAGGKKTIVPDPKYFNMLSDPSMSPAKAIKTLLFPASAAQQADAYLKVLAGIPQEKMQPEALQAQAAAVDADNNGPGAWDALPGIKNDTLVINGTEDVLAPVQNAVLIANAIPAAWLVQVKGAGHGVLFQKPEFIADLVNLFLKN